MKQKRLTCAYLYADGHLVLNYEKQDRDAGSVEWCEIHEKPYPKLSCSFEGRIVLHRYTCDGILWLLKSAVEIRLSKPSTEIGSENSKKRGLAYGSMTIRLASGADLHWSFFPDIISDGVTYQPDCKEAFADITTGIWGSMSIGRIVRAIVPQSETAAA